MNNFDDIATDTLDEWIYFLKNEEIKENFKAQGLKKAKQELDILKLPEQDRLAYARYQNDLHYQASMFESSYTIGVEKGRKERNIEIANHLLATGSLDLQTISSITDLTLEEIKELK